MLSCGGDGLAFTFAAIGICRCRANRNSSERAQIVPKHLNTRRKKGLAMRSLYMVLPLMVFVCTGIGLPGAFAQQKESFVPLFNGRDLSGWVNVNCAPETWSVRDGMIVCTGKPTGVLRTKKQYENFILELDWKHLKKGGNAGLFVHSDALTAPGVPFTRSIEIQIMDGNGGDVFAIHGASLTPDKPHPMGRQRALPLENRNHPAGQWNHYRVESRDGMIRLAVNGKVVSRAYHCNPRKGYICLESEGSEIKGFIAAPMTAYHPDGTINLEIIPSYAGFLRSNGVVGAFVNGTTGEGLSLTVEERIAIAEAWVKAAPADFKVIVHVSHTCTVSVGDMARHAAQIDAGGIGEMGSIFYKPNSIEELVEYVSQTAAHAADLRYIFDQFFNAV